MPGSGQIVLAQGVDEIGIMNCRIIDVNSLEEVRPAHVPLDEVPTAIAADKEQRLLVGLSSGRVLLVNLKSGGTSIPLDNGGQGAVRAAAMATQAPIGATAGEDGRGRVWNLQKAEPMGKPLDHGGTLYAVAFDPLSPKCEIVLTGGNDGQVRFWRWATGEELEPLSHPDAVLSAAYSQDGKVLAVGFGGGGQIYRRNNVNQPWKNLSQFEAETGITRILVWPERELVATGDLHGNLRFWHMMTGQPIGPVHPSPGVVTLLVPADADHILVGTSMANVRRWALPRRFDEPYQQLEPWVESITGFRLLREGDEVRTERLTAHDWLGSRDELKRFPPIAVERQIKEDRPLYPPNPRATPDAGALALAEGFGSFDNPSFQPLSREYLQRYLPGDTVALLGVDVRQLLSASTRLLRTTGDPAASLLAINVSLKVKEWLHESGVDPLYDVHHVLLAGRTTPANDPQRARGARHAARRRGSVAVGDSFDAAFRALTLIIHGTFDRERLESYLKRLDEKYFHIRKWHSVAGFMVIEFSASGHRWYAAATDDALIVSGRYENVRDALQAPEEHDPKKSLSELLEHVDQHQTAWFVAKRDVKLLYGFVSGVLPVPPLDFSWINAFDRVEGGLILSVPVQFKMRAEFSTDAAAREFERTLEQVRPFVRMGGASPVLRYTISPEGTATSVKVSLSPLIFRNMLARR
jgi:hypothetical protein